MFSKTQLDRLDRIAQRMATNDVVPVLCGDKYGLLFEHYGNTRGEPSGLVVELAIEDESGYVWQDRISAYDVDCSPVAVDADGLIDDQDLIDGELYYSHCTFLENQYDYRLSMCNDSVNDFLAQGKTVDEALDELHKQIDDDKVTIPVQEVSHD